MTVAKTKVVRPYAPDYVDAATLAYRLSVSESTVEKLVRTKKLPKALDVFGLPRWKWSGIETLIDRSSDSVETDAFMERLNA
jgi:hypothetical protein